MPRSLGIYSAPPSSWNPAVDTTPALTADFNALLADLSAALTQSLSTDGQTPMTGVLPAYGGGVSFPSIQVPSANPNTLDDYEEGTWTPVDASGAGLTFVNSAGYYTRVGRQVTLQAFALYPITASGATVVIGGLPFTAFFPIDQTGPAWVNNTSLNVQGYVTSSTSSVKLVNNANGTFLTNAQITQAVIRIAVTYYTT